MTAVVEERKVLAGLPVLGEPDFPSRRRGVKQLGEEEFANFLRPVLESPRIEAVRWSQYIPYFNDGDVCEFSAHEPAFKVNDRPGSDELGEDEDGFLSLWDVELKGGCRERWIEGERLATWPYFSNGRWETYGDPVARHQDYGLMKDFADAVEGVQFEEFLYGLFGDHAEVTVYKDRITVESYSHD